MTPSNLIWPDTSLQSKKAWFSYSLVEEENFIKSSDHVKYIKLMWKKQMDTKKTKLHNKSLSLELNQIWSCYSVLSLVWETYNWFYSDVKNGSEADSKGEKINFTHRYVQHGDIMFQSKVSN